MIEIWLSTFSFICCFFWVRFGASFIVLEGLVRVRCCPPIQKLYDFGGDFVASLLCVGCVDSMNYHCVFVRSF
jgi:hypothetical protein